MAKRTARPYQAKVINEYFTCLHAGYKAPVVILPTGGGKCLGKDTPVMLADGTIVPVQDIKVGDQLMGPDSKPRNVLSLARGREELFRVTQDNGDDYIVNRSHILSTRDIFSDKIVNIDITDYLDLKDAERERLLGWKSLVNENFIREYSNITVESIGEGDYYGFEIDGDHLFLLGDFTVTHNTFIFTEIISMMAAAGHRCIVMCHRSELVRQISMSLATQELHHDFICSDKTRAICGNVQQAEFGRTYYRPGAPIVVASVQTINARIKESPKATPQRKAMREATLRLLDNVTFAVFDESHHLTRENTFGRPLQYMRDTTKFLLVTATPERADGKGMGAVSLQGSGIADVVIKGPEMRWLIDQGNLCDYKIYEPPTEQADFTKVRVTASGDYNQQDQAREMDKAKITGDVVRHYQELINGKLTIVFCCDISHAQSVANAYQRAGISAAVLHGGDDESTRFKTLQAFERREILVLVTVDLVSEGFDLPAIEAAQFLRRTMSLSWFMQAFGRVLRPSPGKDYAIILDHVGNWREHGLPDKPRVWSMADRKGGKSSSSDDDTVPVTRCRVPVDKSGRFTPEQCAVMSADEQLNNGIRPCGYIYEITEPRCPDCGCRQPLAPRGEPVMVKGQLVEVSAEELAKMRAGDDSISDQAAVWRQEIQEDLLKLKMSPEEYVSRMHVPAIAKNTQINNHRRWRAMQATLKPLMDEWMEYHQKGDVHKEAAQQLFLNRFGINVYHAQVLKPKECFELIEKIKAHLEEIHVKGGLTYA